MNFQTIIFGIVACLILFLASLIAIVAFIGVLRIAVISVFEYDFIKAFKNKKEKKKDEIV